MSKKRIVVVGNGMVGFKFCERFIASAPIEKYELLVFGEESTPAYDRVHLSEFFNGKTADDLSMAPHTWYSDNGIELNCSELIISIDRDNKQITSQKGNNYSYDKLVIATGSAAFVPPIEGYDKKGVFVYRTIEDLENITSYARELKGKAHAAVLGGGLLGLEAAKAVMDMGFKAHVIEFAERLMPRQLDSAGAILLKEIIEDLDIKIHLSKETKEITGPGVIDGMLFKDGEKLPVNMLLISAGIRPRDELAGKCGLSKGPRGGIVVDDSMCTDDSDIYAIGEVAAYNGMTYGLVAPGYEMAGVAVSSILGLDAFMSSTVDMSSKLKLIGVDVASFGDAQATGEHVKTIAYEDKLKGTYKRINISADGSRLLGGILVGDADDYNMLLQISKNASVLPPNPEDLILGHRGEGTGQSGVMDLPDDAIICSCENIDKQTICCAITSGEAENLKDVCSLTKASTGCGGCKPMVKDLVNETLLSLGQEVKEVICDHFPFSRQELFDIVKIHGHKTFDSVLDSYGNGHGCETCKPALASIFASIYNETAVVQDTIQDTNDRYLANIQRNGTYSVVPRVAGGEITPDKLIAIGAVAKKYDLYTKITGGQRIDLFGARLDQLPFIWEELIDAGFESGHAYGKALRTVKSCVGSTWCRYGMDEAVSFAITLEDRYKGIRSPHKLKGGVSGCIRECAEARCKDFGVIATEDGWNLYVCGNGGANPKHAQLLAESIDNETCIKYIDRFLMYYLRTAPPLTRTAAWLDKLDGGMVYLKDLIVHDTLSLGATLEEEMKFMVNTYKCEWKEVVESPELRKRFRHFINSGDTDENIKFVPLREQKIPTPW